MCHNQLSIIKDVVADEAVNEVRNVALRLRRLRRKLLQGFAKAVRKRRIFAAQYTHQTNVMITRNAERLPRCDKLGDELQHLRRSGSAIYQIANKDQPAPFRRQQREHIALNSKRVTQLRQQISKFIKTTMHVSNDVKRPMLQLAIVV